MTINYFYKLSKSVLLCMALISSGMVLLVPTAQAVNVSVQNFRGTWNAAAHYRAGDVVGYQNQSYITQQANQGQTPASTSQVWNLLVAQGPQGLQGVPGIPGIQGVPGIPGAKGDTGATGQAGPQGIQGVSGQNGSSVPTHRVGDYFGGGIIFDVDTSGQHGLIAALADQSAGVTWSNSNVNYRLTGTSGDELGAGAMNTTLIIATQIGVNPTVNFAAKMAADYSVQADGTSACTGSASETCYGDWYLPSKYELSLMYNRIGQGTPGNAGAFADTFYWSSTENTNTLAWNQFFGNGLQGVSDKFFALGVRAVRAF